MIGVMLTSCSPFSSSINIDEQIKNPNEDAWLENNIKFSEGSKIPQNWWNAFQDEQLNIIMNDFLENNYDLKIALLLLGHKNVLA